MLARTKAVTGAKGAVKPKAQATIAPMNHPTSGDDAFHVAIVEAATHRHNSPLVTVPLGTAAGLLLTWRPAGDCAVDSRCIFNVGRKVAPVLSY